MRSLKRITADSFRNGGVKGAGFGDVHKGRMALEGFDFVADIGAKCLRTGLLAHWDGEKFVLPEQQLADLAWFATECQLRSMYAAPVLCIAEADHIRLWTDAAARQSFLAIWAAILRKFRGRTVFACMEALNEPLMTEAVNAAVYWSLIDALVNLAAQIDPKRVLGIQTWPGGRVDSRPEWGEFWRPQPPQHIATAHDYSPFGFTHHGLGWAVGEHAKRFDWQTTLQEHHSGLLYLRNVMLADNRAVWISETSCEQSQPGAVEWVRHMQQLNRAWGFSYSWHYVHGPREWHPNGEVMPLLVADFRRKP